MKHTKIVRSEFKTGNVMVLILGAIATIIIGIILILTSKDTIGGYLMGTLFLGFGLFFFYVFIRQNHLIITQDKLFIHSIFGQLKKVIPLKEFKYYTEIEKQTAGGSDSSISSWKELTLYTDSAKYTIHSTTYKNYSTIRRKFIKRIDRNITIEKEWYRKNNLTWAYGYTILGILFSIPLFIVENQETTGLLFWSCVCLSFICLGIRNIMKYQTKRK